MFVDMRMFLITMFDAGAWIRNPSPEPESLVTVVVGGVGLGPLPPSIMMLLLLLIAISLSKQVPLTLMVEPSGTRGIEFLIFRHA
jgi:hypothetical protein